VKVVRLGIMVMKSGLFFVDRREITAGAKPRPSQGQDLESRESERGVEFIPSFGQAG
jgi:hypothetical protein